MMRLILASWTGNQHPLHNCSYCNYRTAQLDSLQLLPISSSENSLKTPNLKLWLKQFSHLLLQKLLRCFGLGFAIGTVLKTPTSLRLIFRMKNPIYQWILNKDNVSLGTFLATMSSLHQVRMPYCETCSQCDVNGFDIGKIWKIFLCSNPRLRNIGALMPRLPYGAPDCTQL